ncbi:MAG: cysteine hydrolase family protein [Anaerolineae bacterium]|nr:cysteine hydrolase family protein [Anaerolineae bacterium]MDW8173214.1 cysteine hydrolase family protein [Anaerolineae bacterium]
MAYPGFYAAERVGELYTPQSSQAIQVGRSAGCAPAQQDRQRIILLLVDMQVDFVHPEGALSVPGAVEDTRRTIEFIYRYACKITSIAASLDSHLPLQIFSPSWWTDEKGEHPPPYTVISAEEVSAGHWRPLYEIDWSKRYVQQLEAQSRKQLMIWPYHTLIGTPGHNLMPALYEAIAFHASARQTQPIFLQKGDEPLTEHYSILEPEVKVPRKAILNTDFLSVLASYDLIYIAGQAKSHCVLESVSSMMNYFSKDIVARIRVLDDAMSSVAHPTIDFEALSEQAFARYSAQGLTRRKTTDPLG